MKYQLSNPLNPEKKESLEYTRKWSNENTELKKQIHEYIEQAVTKGIVGNREEVIQLLQKSGFKITRKGKEYISVKTDDMKRAIRLKGDFYEENFRGITDLETKHRERERAYQKTLSERVGELKKRLDERVAKDAERNIRRYKATKQTNLGEHRLGIRTNKEMESIQMGDRGNVSRRDVSGDNKLLHSTGITAERTANTGNATKINTTEKTKLCISEIGIQTQQSIRPKPDYVSTGKEKIETVNRMQVNNKEDENENVRRAITRVRGTRATIQSIVKNATKRDITIETRDKEFSPIKQAVDWTIRIINNSISEIGKKFRNRVKEVKMVLDEELEKFKTEINIADIAIAMGYYIDKTKTSRRAIVLKNGQDVIIVSRNSNGHYVYFNPENEQDNGTIIDFVQKRTNKNLGQVRKILRQFQAGTTKHLEKTNLTDIRNQYKVYHKFENLYNAIMQKSSEYLSIIDNYLIKAQRYRGISGKTLLESENVIITDNSFYFPIYDTNAMCGIYRTDTDMKEKKFIKDSIKGIWADKKINKEFPIKKIVITESPIDALSAKEYKKIKKYDDVEQTLYVSTFGRMGKEAKETLKKLFKKLPNAEVIIATDMDDAGQSLAKEIGEIAEKAGNKYLRLELPVKDMNDLLQATIKEQKKRKHSYHFER